MQFSKIVYAPVEKFPIHEKYALSDQVRRAVVSIPSSIAEGCGRISNRDYAHFLSIVRDSLYETMTQLELTKSLGYVDSMEHAESLVSEIGRNGEIHSTLQPQLVTSTNMLSFLIKSADWKFEKHIPVITFLDDFKPGEPLEVVVAIEKEVPHPDTPEHNASQPPVNIGRNRDARKRENHIPKCTNDSKTRFPKYGNQYSSTQRFLSKNDPVLTDFCPDFIYATAQEHAKPQ